MPPKKQQQGKKAAAKKQNQVRRFSLRARHKRLWRCSIMLLLFAAMCPKCDPLSAAEYQVRDLYNHHPEFPRSQGVLVCCCAVLLESAPRTASFSFAAVFLFRFSRGLRADRAA